MKKLGIALGMIAVLVTMAFAGIAQARNGADDPAGDDSAVQLTQGGQGADDPAGDDRGTAGQGADDPAGDDRGTDTAAPRKAATAKSKRCARARTKAHRTGKRADRIRAAKACHRHGHGADDPAGHR
jgi:hypothetical protein